MIDLADTVYLSIVSLWEMAIKLNLGKLSLKRSYETIEQELESSDISLLPITFIFHCKYRRRVKNKVNKTPFLHC